jgi:SAM-dependent methyltransferase
MKLNIGSGPCPKDGWTNVDADPTVSADVHADALAYLASLPADSVQEVYAGHFLEHLEKPAADRFLAECYRVLAPGGVCAIVVPDTREILKRYIAQAIDEIPFDGRLWRLNDLDDVCGWFLYGSVNPSRHLWSYDEFTLRRAMRAAGFEDLKRLDRYRDARLAGPAWFQAGYEGRKLMSKIIQVIRHASNCWYVWEMNPDGTGRNTLASFPTEAEAQAFAASYRNK